MAEKSIGVEISELILARYPRLSEGKADPFDVAEVINGLGSTMGGIFAVIVADCGIDIMETVADHFMNRCGEEMHAILEKSMGRPN